MLTVQGKKTFGPSRTPLRLPKIAKQASQVRRQDLVDGDMNYLRRKNLTADDSKKRINLLINKKEHEGFRMQTDGPSKFQTRLLAQRRGGYQSMSLGNKPNIKIDDLIHIQGVNRKLPKSIDKPTTEQDKVARDFIKAKGYKLKEIQQSRDGDSFTDTTESAGSMRQALAKFKGTITLKSVQQNYKDCIMLLSIDLKINMADMFEDILNIGVTMLKFDTYPSVYFTTDIWRSMLFIVTHTILDKVDVKETLIKEVFDTLKVYIKLKKLNVQSDLAVIGAFFSKLYSQGSRAIRAIDLYAVKGFVQFIAWILGHLESTYFDDHCYIRHISLPNEYSAMFSITRQVLADPIHEPTFSKSWLEWIGQKCHSLIFDFRASESIILNADAHWTTVIFDLVLSVMINPRLSIHLINRWQLEVDESVDQDDTDVALADAKKNQKLVEFMDLLLSFTNRAMDEPKNIKRYAGLILTLLKIMECGSLIPGEDPKQAHFLELAVLSKMNMFIFDISRGLKEKTIGHEIFPFLDSLIECSSALCQRVQGKDKKACQQVIRNGIHELLTAYKSNKIIGHDKTEINTLESMIKRIIQAIII